MEKSPQAFRTISEVSEVVGVPAHVLRFWEGKFTQIKPVKRGGGRRYYRPQDVDLIVAIRELLYTDGLTIRGVQKLFKEHGVKHVVARHGIALAPLAPTDDQLDGEQVEVTGDDEDLWNDVPDAGLIAPMQESVAMTDDAQAAQQTSKADPARAAAMRSVLTRLESLRAHMATHPTPDLVD